MSSRVSTLSQVFRNCWSAVTGKKHSARETLYPSEVVLHDPGAQRPHDLDDPFVDPTAQARMGDAIASAMEKKK
jgi:hypothetical protein